MNTNCLMCNICAESMQEMTMPVKLGLCVAYVLKYIIPIYYLTLCMQQYTEMCLLLAGQVLLVFLGFSSPKSLTVAGR